MRSRYGWIFGISFSTLLVELLLVRVFDAIMSVYTSYAIVTCALFGTGLAGIAVAVRPGLVSGTAFRRLRGIGIAAAGSYLALLPALNALPFEAARIGEAPATQIAAFAVMYLCLILPFFLSGLGIVFLFTSCPGSIRSLYFWDLSGAAAGCVLLPVLLPALGPAGVLAIAAGVVLGGSASLSGAAAAKIATGAAGLGLLALSFSGPLAALDFKSHTERRGTREAELREEPEFKRWDPISKIEVVDLRRYDPATGRPLYGTDRKLISYDGGAQSSHIYPFDGDYAGLRADLADRVLAHFWQRGVLASHYLKRDRGAKVLVLGCAGGQEVKAARLYGAAEVDAVDLVQTVVDLGHGRYADYNGGIFLDPRVRFRRGEGRSLLQGSDARYDVIQIFSYHNSARIAAGAMAIQAYYLQTAEAYATYFRHLADDGVLQVSQAFPTRAITTAALAWRRLGWSDFQSHVVVYLREGFDDHPTILFKRSPWTAGELDDLDRFFSAGFREADWRYSCWVDPRRPRESFLSPIFFSGSYPDTLAARIPYRADPLTDDRPFYHFVRKGLGPVPVDPARYVDPTTAQLLNQQQVAGLPVPRDLAHLFLTALVCVLYAGIFLLAPLRAARPEQDRIAGRGWGLAYFSALGAGFIIVELIAIQLVIRLIGYPLYAFSTVLFTLLLAAGLGSLVSGRIGVGPDRRARVAFGGILIAGFLFWALHAPLFDLFLGAPLAVRIVVAGAALAPLGFFLGMPFPLGVLALRTGSGGAIAWGWGMNSLFTVIGGFASVLLGLLLGFGATLLIALGLYLAAGALFAGMRRATAEGWEGSRSSAGAR